jgi:hypothetical protein
MGARARRVVEEEFTLQVAGRRMLEAYREIMARREEVAA